MSDDPWDTTPEHERMRTSDEFDRAVAEVEAVSRDNEQRRLKAEGQLTEVEVEEMGAAWLELQKVLPRGMRIGGLSRFAGPTGHWIASVDAGHPITHGWIRTGDTPAAALLAARDAIEAERWY